MIRDRRPVWRRLSLALASLALFALAACSGGSDGGECTTCPPPPPETGALRLEVGYEPAATALQPAGFSASDVTRVDVTIAGTNQTENRSLEPGVNRAFFDLEPGPYAVTATGFGPNDLVLFTDALDVTIAAGDTADVALELEAALGTVTLQIDGQTSGDVDAVAGEGVPFVVEVRNTQGRPVQGSAVRLTPSDPDYARVAFEGTTETDAQGRATGTINAPFSGATTLSLEVDGRSIASPGPTRVVFATGVVAGRSNVSQPVYSGPRLNQQPVAGGEGRFAFTVTVQNATGDPLPDVPVTPRSLRNTGVESDVDIIEPASGYESGVTDHQGVFKFTVRTFTSSFFELNEAGQLRSTDGTFVPGVIEVFADGVQVGQSSLLWNSPVHPNLGALTSSKRFVQANGQDFAVIIVNAERFASLGQGPVRNAYVEIVTPTGEILNEELNLVPEPGFDGFRTNEQGEWRGRASSNVPGNVFFRVKVDGRSLILDNLRALTFQ